MFGRKAQTVGLLLVAFALGSMAGSASWMPFGIGADTTPPAASPFTMQMRIGGNLYLQTSAEYRAACLQTYRCATDRMHELAKTSAPRPAVIMDLDETVFDNSSFQTYLYLTGQEYTDALWANYEQNYSKDVTLIPGAKEFIAEAYSAGVAVVFLSNRVQTYQASTIAALERLGVAGTNVADRLYLKEKADAPSDKASRRDQVTAKYNVIMLIGDNLRDFSEVFVNPKLPATPTAQDVLSAAEKRKEHVDRATVHWGRNWFIIPNPVYGEWDRLVKVDPVSLMHPTSIPTTPK